MRSSELERAEIDLVIECIRRRYGYDFRNYSFASLHRRFEQLRSAAGLSRYTEMVDKLFHDENYFELLLRQMSIVVTEMFRDPEFYAALRELALPMLKTYPFAKIWHAGCATGQEAYSMAILLHENDYLPRARIYGTDFNKNALDTAQKGVYPAEAMAKCGENYAKAGGEAHFSEYFSDAYGLCKMKDFLGERITFSYHNLVTDSVFGEMNIIFCRNVLIYFDRELQDRVLRLFSDSLRHGGFLCLGNKETLNFTAVQDIFETVDTKNRIYKKIGDVRHAS